ncbi:MAG: VOC family protein [Cyclobacteriaceae bacterium]
MQKSTNWLLLVFIVLSSCSNEENRVLTAFEVYCEMVANDAKPMALHYPMEAGAIDELWNEFEQVAEKYQVQLYREDDFPVSNLFPAALTEGKTVAMIYRGNRLDQYKQWKNDLRSADSNDREESEALARRFGRLMGYGIQGINELLRKSSDYRDLASFNVEQQITHLYYNDVDEAVDFYSNTLGFAKTGSSSFQVSKDAFIELHALNDIHVKGEPKSTAIAFLTDQLAEWYTYVQHKNVPIKYTYKPKEGGLHDGFVAIDPGGYLLEFEQFKQHPENELFMAELSQAPRIATSVDLSFYGSITWTYHKNLLLMQNFYEEVLGYQLVADQGWTKIYQTSATGFIGLVDERRGMEDYADTKAVEIEWKISDEVLFDAYAEKFWQQYDYGTNSLMGPEKYFYHVNGTNL